MNPTARGGGVEAADDGDVNSSRGALHQTQISVSALAMVNGGGKVRQGFRVAFGALGDHPHVVLGFASQLLLE